MDFSEINPRIRFASKIRFYGNGQYVSAYDHRFFFILAGCGTAAANGKDFSVSPGDAFLWQSGTVYRFRTENQLDAVSINFDYTLSAFDGKNLFPPEPIDSFVKEKILEHVVFDDAPALNGPVKVSLPAEKSKLDVLISSFAQKKIFYSERCSALFKDILVDVLQNGTNILGKAEKAIEYIEKNYPTDITNGDIAAAAGYHPYHLSKLMLSCTGKTLHRYLLEYRLDRARELLSDKKKSIAEIAKDCGFCSPYHMSNAFKAEYGITPSKYRENI